MAYTITDIAEGIRAVGASIVTLTGTRANRDLSNLSQTGEAKLGKGGAGVPVGTVIAYMGTNEPEGFLLMDGRNVSRTVYADLFAVVGTSMGAGDGSTTFTIADMTDGRYLMGSTVAGGRNQVSEQLPNITGNTYSVMAGGAFTNNGALYQVKEENGHTTTMTAVNLNWVRIYMDASKSSTIYTNNAHVIPNSIKCSFYIRY